MTDAGMAEAEALASRKDDGNQGVAEQDRADGTSGDLSHLHPSVRALARADEATRLRAIGSKRWITHHPAGRVLASLRRAFEQEPGDRMLNVLLLAESGMGRTMLLKKFRRDYAVPFDHAGPDSGVGRRCWSCTRREPRFGLAGSRFRTDRIPVDQRRRSLIQAVRH